MDKDEVLEVIDFISSWLLEGEIDVKFLRKHNNRDFLTDEYLRYKSGMPFSERTIEMKKQTQEVN